MIVGVSCKHYIDLDWLNFQSLLTLTVDPILQERTAEVWL